MAMTRRSGAKASICRDQIEAVNRQPGTSTSVAEPAGPGPESSTWIVVAASTGTLTECADAPETGAAAAVAGAQSGGPATTTIKAMQSTRPAVENAIRLDILSFSDDAARSIP
jgi:hypothetical protein